MTSIALQITPKNLSVIANVSYTGPPASEFLIFYRINFKILKKFASIMHTFSFIVKETSFILYI